MKKMIVITFIILIVFSLSFALFYSINYKNNKINLNKSNVSEEKIKIEKEIIVPDEEEITEIQVDQNIPNHDTKVIEKSSTTIPTTPEDKSVVENKNSSNINNNSSTPVVENKDDIELEENNTSINETIPPVIEEETEQENFIDEELQKLTNQVEFSSYDECMKVGFDTALKDTINILGFSCPYIVYKGQILGYRLQLDYTNPMQN